MVLYGGVKRNAAQTSVAGVGAKSMLLLLYHAHCIVASREIPITTAASLFTSTATTSTERLTSTWVQHSRMFARTMLRSCTRNGLLTARHPPRILPKAAIPRPLFFSQQPRLLRQERPSPPPLRRIQIRAKPRYGYTQEEINNAKPLITNETLAGLVRSSQFRWLLLLAASGGVIFYYSNLEIVPVSGRQRFNCYSDASVEAEGLMAYNAILREMEGRILPTWDPRYRMVSRVMKRLIPASGLADANWEVHVVQNQSKLLFCH